MDLIALRENHYASMAFPLGIMHICTNSNLISLIEKMSKFGSK